MNGPWEDYQVDDDGPWADYAPEAEKPKTFFQKAKDLVSMAGDAVAPYQASQQFAPQQMLQEVQGLASSAYGKAGDISARQLTAEGMNPRVASGIGTIIGAAPDITAMLSGPPLAPKASSLAKPFAKRAMGFPKQMLKTPELRQAADTAAEVALKNDVIPFSGDPRTMLSRTEGLNQKAGRRIGSFLKRLPPDEVNIPDNSPVRQAPLALPAPKTPAVEPGPIRVRQVDSVDPALYMREYKPGRKPSSSDVKRFRELGWDSVETTDGSTVWGDPKYLADLKPDFFLKGSAVARPRGGFAPNKTDVIYSENAPLKKGESVRAFLQRKGVSANDDVVEVKAIDAPARKQIAERVWFKKQDAIDAINTVRRRDANGRVLRDGEYAEEAAIIDKAIETVNAHPGTSLPWKTANELKSFLQERAKYDTDAGSAPLRRKIAARFLKALDSSLEEVANKTGNAKGFAAFKENKRLFGATETMKKGLNNEISSQDSRMFPSFASLVATAGTKGPGGVAKMFAFEAARRRGAGAAARTLNQASRGASGIGIPKAISLLSTRRKERDKKRN